MWNWVFCCGVWVGVWVEDSWVLSEEGSRMIFGVFDAILMMSLMMSEWILWRVSRVELLGT